jgi:phosphomevalonate kinase
MTEKKGFGAGVAVKTVLVGVLLLCLLARERDPRKMSEVVHMLKSMSKLL